MTKSQEDQRSDWADYRAYLEDEAKLKQMELGKKAPKKPLKETKEEVKEENEQPINPDGQ